MPRKTSQTLTDAELRLMEVLWKHGPSTVAEVTEAIPKRDKVAYSTVLTTLRILERKGYLTHEERGRAFVYQTVVDREQARVSTVRHLLKRFFDGSPSELLLNVIENEDLNEEELRRVRKVLQEADGDR